MTRNVILVCGGRDFDDYHWLARELTKLKPTKLVNGGAIGADRLSSGWAVAHDVPFEEFPADWKNFGRKAGPMRNAQMLKSGPIDLVLAFPGGVGTADMVQKARAAGIRVIDLAHDDT